MQMRKSGGLSGKRDSAFFFQSQAVPPIRLKEVSGGQRWTNSSTDRRLISCSRLLPQTV